MTAASFALRRLLIGVPSVGLGAYTVLGDEPKRFASNAYTVAYNTASVPLRLSRDVKAAATILAGELSDGPSCSA